MEASQAQALLAAARSWLRRPGAEELSWKGAAALREYERTGRRAEIKPAVATFRRAVALTSPDYPNAARYRSNECLLGSVDDLPQRGEILVAVKASAQGRRECGQEDGADGCFQPVDIHCSFQDASASARSSGSAVWRKRSRRQRPRLPATRHWSPSVGRSSASECRYAATASVNASASRAAASSTWPRAA